MKKKTTPAKRAAATKTKPGDLAALFTQVRDLARDHFARQSQDGRLHCFICNWAPPLALTLTGPIVEIHHGLGISQYPADGRALTFEEAIQHLTPLCPNCHRILHAKKGGGAFTLKELKKETVVPEGKANS